ncbi:MAG: recombinase family protein [Gammaproteobacteria bacterium]|nr:MAG: recombinase family protein [Gammaproteobacteria bacterium]
MKVKYNRVSTLQQSGDRFGLDNGNYDVTLLDKVSGSMPFRDRPKGKEVLRLVEAGEVSDLVVEEFSRLGRNTGDVIRTLEWLEEKKVNVHVLNNGLQSRPNGKKNPIWKMISSVMSSLYEMELENIKERTMMGRAVYVQKGGKLGRPKGSNESERQFLNKAKSHQILKYLNKKRTIREISKITSASNKTIIKVKQIGAKYGMLQ